jgi:hypothetical protein
VLRGSVAVVLGWVKHGGFELSRRQQKKRRRRKKISASLGWKTEQAGALQTGNRESSPVRDRTRQSSEEEENSPTAPPPHPKRNNNHGSANALRGRGLARLRSAIHNHERPIPQCRGRWRLAVCYDDPPSGTNQAAFGVQGM